MAFRILFFLLLLILMTGLKVRANDFLPILVQAEYFLMEKDSNKAQRCLDFLQEKYPQSPYQDLFKQRLNPLQFSTAPVTLDSLLNLVKKMMGNSSSQILCLPLSLKKKGQILIQNLQESQVLQKQLEKGIDSLLAREIGIYFRKEVEEWKYQLRLHSYLPLSNEYYLDFQTYVDWLEWQSLKISSLKKLIGKDKDSDWVVEMENTFELVSFMISQLGRSGLLNKQRKKWLRNELMLSSFSLDYWYQKYQGERDSHVYLKKIFCHIAATQGNISQMRSRLYGKPSFLNSLGRSLWSDLQASNIALPDSLLNIHEFIRLSQNRASLYQIDQLKSFLMTPSNAGIFEKLRQPSTFSTESFLLIYDLPAKLYFLFFQNGKITCNRLEKTVGWLKKLERIKETICSPEQGLLSNPQSLDSFFQASNELYHEVFSPLWRDAIPPNLHVLPDGYFHYIPLESLIINLPTSQSQPPGYLLFQSSISYWDAASDLLNIQQNKASFRLDSYKYFFPKYAINFKGKEQIRKPPLPSLKGGELKVLEEYFIGDSCLRNPFLPQYTLDQKQKNCLLHLSLHTSTGEDLGDGLIYLSNKEGDQISLSELSLMPSSPKAIVWGTCGSGIGSYTPGEGLASLGANLHLSGCRSSIRSLSHLPDHTATALLSHFYLFLSKDVSSARSLQEAKVKFLKQADRFYKHPFFWAGYLHHGDSFVMK